MTPRARIACAGAVGALAATAVFAWIVFGGRADPLAPETLGGIYDAQADSLLHGHWDMPAQERLFERFTIDGRYYTYFGPWPAILRMPIMAFTDGYFGRLSRVSMVLAFAVLVAFAARLAWQARTIVRGIGPVGWRSLVATGGFVFVTGCGSTALFIGSRALANHEAILWGIAWSVAAFSGIVAYLQYGRGWSLVWACVAATLALSSRASVGLGPVLALGGLLAVRIVQRASDWWSTGRRQRTGARPARWLGRWLGVDGESARGSIWQAAIAVTIPVALYAYVNYSKFGSFFGVPIEKQDFQLQRPERRAVLAATGNSLFGLDYVPTNLVQYLRPDAIGFRQTFPWITFSDRPHVFGGVTFDDIEPSASVTITSVLLVTLAIIGIVAAVRGVRARRDDEESPESSRGRLPVTAAAFRIPLLGAVLTTASTLAIADLYQRYQGDFLPLLVVGAAVGLVWLQLLLAGRGPWARRVVGAALIVLAVWSCWVVFGLTLIYQREYGGLQPLALRPGFVSFQLDLNEALGLDLPSVRHGRSLPARKGDPLARTDVPHGQLFVVGDCDGLFVSTGRAWEAIEAPPAGQRRWRVRFGEPTPGVRQPLWSTGAGPDQVLWADWIDESHVRFEYESTGSPSTTITGERTLEVEPGQAYDLDVRLDPAESYLEVAHDGELLFETFARSFTSDRAATTGRQPDPALDATEFAGSIRPKSITPICDRLTQ